MSLIGDALDRAARGAWREWVWPSDRVVVALTIAASPSSSEPGLEAVRSETGPDPHRQACDTIGAQPSRRERPGNFHKRRLVHAFGENTGDRLGSTCREGS